MKSTKASTAWKALVTLVILVSSLPASAGLITMDFDDAGLGGTSYVNTNWAGFRISPKCHTHIMSLGEYPPSATHGNALGFDGSGCLTGYVNPEYIGTELGVGDLPGPPVVIDYSGRGFSLESFLHNRTGGFIVSSKGGRIDFDVTTYPPYWITETLSGPQWTGIRWIAVGGNDYGAPGYLFDEFVFRVSEPSTLALTLVALFGIARRRI